MAKRPERFSKSELKKRLYRAAGGRCHYCRLKLTFTESTIDHKKAKSMNGRYDWKNVALACLRCNQEKMNLACAWYKALWKQRLEERQRKPFRKKEE
jgi:uncharacterized protein (TIGR02646 family)